MADLYMFYLGGTAPGSNIEVHDIQFAVVDRPEAAYGKLAAHWFGDLKTLHVDAEVKVNWADGYDISIADQPADPGIGLFFVHMGGYVAGDIDEKHSYDLLVAKNKAAAMKKAKDKFCQGDLLPHRDILFEVDGCILVSSVDGRHVHLTPNPDGQREVPAYRYTPIGKDNHKYNLETHEVTAADGTAVDDVRTPATPMAG